MSDIHADYRTTKHTNAQGINLREADGYVALSRCIGDIIENEVDAVVVCGDVFHTPTPSVRAVVFVQNQFRRLAKAGIPMYALAGNHDTNDIRADVAASRILHDPARKIYSHAEPYVTHEIAPGISLHMVSHHMFADQQETMGNIRPVSGNINIFSTHGSIIDPILKERLHTNQSPREVVIPDFLMEDFDWDYCLMGHIHERGWVGSKDKKTDTLGKKLYYNGSLIRRGFSDGEAPLGRGWTLWEIDTDGTMTATPKTVPQRPQLDFPVIDCSTLSAQEISDRIVENLKNTRIDGKGFDASTAPILRQRLSAITPAKHSSMDWASIDAVRDHAFSWTVRVLSTAEQQVEQKETSSDSIEGTDIISVYDNWVDKSNALSHVTDNDVKERIKRETRKFMEAGQEAVLGDD